MVSALSPQEIAELFEARAVLECYMIRQAISHFEEGDFQHAEEVLKQFENSLEDDSETRNWGCGTGNFTPRCTLPPIRPVIMGVLKGLNNNCDRYTRLHLVFTRALHRFAESHCEP